MRYEVNVNAIKKPEGSLRGFASVVFEECLKVSNIAIVENKDGELFVSMPAVPRKPDIRISAIRLQRSSVMSCIPRFLIPLRNT